MAGKGPELGYQDRGHAIEDKQPLKAKNANRACEDTVPKEGQRRRRSQTVLCAALSARQGPSF